MKKLLVLALVSLTVFSLEPDWSDSTVIKPWTNRENVYQLNEADFKEVTNKGLIHTVSYPISVTGLLIPYEPVVNYFKNEDKTWFEKILQSVGESTTGIKSESDLYKWLGLNTYNESTASGIYNIPRPDNFMPGHRMGTTIIETKNGKGLTFSCAACHTANLFGTTVMGLTNKVPQANKLFVMAKKTIPLISPKMFKKFTHATNEEVAMYKRTKSNLRSVGAIKPQSLGLDTSFPQVALSLARRKNDSDATKSRVFEVFPRHNALSNTVADSKPMPWWTLKYKTRWLADGSIVAGNPIYTNFLWNEIGRGADLKELQKWLEDNQQKVRELTAAAFATTPPAWTDFFPESSIDLAAAKRGEKTYIQSCKKCHGHYEKRWSLDGAQELSVTEQIKTTGVLFHSKTPVLDVGTDPKRYEGIKHFASALNNLNISKYMETVVEPQKGYIPQPLDGVWSRYPYLHNNSIPNLCELFKAPKDRVKTFYQIPSENRESDFDSECVGFPIGDAIPNKRKVKEAFFNTTKSGMNNSGHYYRIFTNKDGSERYTSAQKRDLIVYLKTL